MKKLIFSIIALLLISSSAFAQPKGYWRLTYSHPPGRFAPFPIESTFLFNLDTSRFFSTSTDGGDSWSANSSVRIPNNMGLFFLTRTLFFGFQSDSQAFMKSDDGGLSWIKLFVIKDSMASVERFTMWNPSSGFILYTDAHQHYHDLVTHDGGNTFTDLGHDSLLRSIANDGRGGFDGFSMVWLDSLNGLLWASATRRNILLVTHNGAKDWQFVHVYTPSGDTTVRLTNSGSGYVDTYSLHDVFPKPYFYYSTDYGDHWQTSDTATMPSNLGQPSQTSRIAFWTSAQEPKSDPNSAPYNVVYYTNDLGKHWIADYVTFKDYGVGGFTFPDSLHGFASAGEIGQTKDTIYFFKFIAGSSGVAQSGNQVDASDLEIYPNPCNNIVHLRTSRSFTAFHIINLLGQCVMSSSESEQSVFDTSRLLDGIYTLECIAKDGTPDRRSFLKITP